MVERITLEVRFGEASFTAEGPADVVLAMYQDWMHLLSGCDHEAPEGAPALPAFRGQLIGRA